MKIFSKRYLYISSKRYLYIISSISLALFVSGAVWGVTSKRFESQSVTIPSPIEALRQADLLSPAELTELEIDEVIRDRLRFDPQWQEIAQAVRQDLIVLKWSKQPLTNPIWKRYGAKAYPLLAYYARSRDRLRQRYGMAGIRSLGKPYTTLWLTQRIKQRLPRPDMDVLTENVEYLLNQSGTTTPYDSKDWEKDFGLDEPETRDRLVRLARIGLEPESSPTYYDQFNLAFLQRLLGYEAVANHRVYPDRQLKPFARLSEWLQFESLERPNNLQIEQAIHFYNSLPEQAQDYILIERLGKLKAGEITNFARAFFRQIAANLDAPDRAWAIAELDRHSDPVGEELLQKIVNGDLSQLYPLSRPVGYESYSERGFYAYYLLLGIVDKYPQSKYTQGCREYGNLTGKSYFDSEPRSQEILVRNARMTPKERSQNWQQWLSRYPDHPGADDATYLFARSLQAQNEVMPALRLWVKMMVQPMGDKDAAYLAWPHVRALLDVGLTTEQIEILLTEPEIQPIAPLFQYALAVRYARSQNYAKALQIAQTIHLTDMPKRVLDTYYQNFQWWEAGDRSAKVIQEMQTMLTEQRQRWQKLLALQQENTPEARYRLASDWAGKDGWKNGYLPFWDGFRLYHLPTGGWGDDECLGWWICNTKLRSADIVRSTYQASSQNAVALSLYQSILDDANTPPSLREKTLYMVAMTLLEQWEEHDFGETVAIHPPAGITSDRSTIASLKFGAYQDYQNREKQIQNDYQRRIDSIISELQLKFPQSTYTDDLLFSSFFLSDRPRYLSRLIERYPQSDRAAEARFLLEHLPSKLGE
ncbi:hypothetical protein [Tumidithrix elongata]|uniref:hypothetical protein n=1 Tax=Tumidithrix elongata TaxID=3088357 RepID=UPI002ED2B629